MVTSGFFNSDIFAWVVLPLLIFLARICDVSLDTLRLIFVAKGIRKVAANSWFLWVIIWLLAVSQIMKHLDNVICYIAYGGGFAMGQLHRNDTRRKNLDRERNDSRSPQIGYGWSVNSYVSKISALLWWMLKVRMGKWRSFFRLSKGK